MKNLFVCVSILRSTNNVQGIHVYQNTLKQATCICFMLFYKFIKRCTEYMYLYIEYDIGINGLNRNGLSTDTGLL